MITYTTPNNKIGKKINFFTYLSISQNYFLKAIISQYCSIIVDFGGNKKNRQFTLGLWKMAHRE